MSKSTVHLKLVDANSESEKLRTRLNDGVTNLLGIAEVLEMLGTHVATDHDCMLTLLARDLHREAETLGDAEVFLRQTKAVS